MRNQFVPHDTEARAIDREMGERAPAESMWTTGEGHNGPEGQAPRVLQPADGDRW